MSTVMEMPNAEQLVKRLFKVAEILSRTPSDAQSMFRRYENDRKNHDPLEIGYCESVDRFMDT